MVDVSTCLKNLTHCFYIIFRSNRNFYVQYPKHVMDIIRLANCRIASYSRKKYNPWFYLGISLSDIFFNAIKRFVPIWNNPPWPYKDNMRQTRSITNCWTWSCMNKKSKSKSKSFLAQLPDLRKLYGTQENSIGSSVCNPTLVTLLLLSSHSFLHTHTLSLSSLFVMSLYTLFYQASISYIFI